MHLEALYSTHAIYPCAGLPFLLSPRFTHWNVLHFSTTGTVITFRQYFSLAGPWSPTLQLLSIFICLTSVFFGIKIFLNISATMLHWFSLSCILSKIAWSRSPTGTVFSTGPIVHIPRRLVWRYPHHHSICSSRSLFSPSKRGTLGNSRVLKGIRLDHNWFFLTQVADFGMRVLIQDLVCLFIHLSCRYLSNLVYLELVE